MTNFSIFNLLSTIVFERYCAKIHLGNEVSSISIRHAFQNFLHIFSFFHDIGMKNV